MAHDNNGNLLVSQGLAPYAQITREGEMWSTMIATPIAAIVALPTTLANLEVHNNGQRYMIVDTIWAWQLTGTAVAWGANPWAQVGAPVYSANAALVIGGGNGSTQTSATTSEIRTAITQTVVANGWRVFPGSTISQSVAAATPGILNVGNVEGRLVVPPGRSLHVCVTASVNTASAFHVGASWFMAEA